MEFDSPLYALLERYRKPESSLLDHLTNVIRHRQYFAKDIWINRGDVPRNICFILEGGAIAYYFSEDRKRNTSRVWSDGDLILLAEHGLTMSPTDLQIIFPMDSEVLELSYRDLIALRRSHTQMQQYIDDFIAEELLFLDERIRYLNSASVEQRIQDFKDRYPLLDRHLTDIDKASYLRISRRWYGKKKYSSY